MKKSSSWSRLETGAADAALAGSPTLDSPDLVFLMSNVVLCRIKNRCAYLIFISTPYNAQQKERSQSEVVARKAKKRLTPLGSRAAAGESRNEPNRP